MVEWVSTAPLNVYNFHPKSKTMSCNGHLNWTMLQSQQKPGIEMAVRQNFSIDHFWISVSFQV